MLLPHRQGVAEALASVSQTRDHAQERLRKAHGLARMLKLAAQQAADHLEDPGNTRDPETGRGMPIERALCHPGGMQVRIERSLESGLVARELAREDRLRGKATGAE